MAISELVKWDQMNEYLVWKYPNNELSTWTQLVVNESQEALFIKDGVLHNVFSAGRYTLDTENFPILRNLYSIPFGGKSPFTAEIWFVNKTSVLDVKWGTPQPLELLDPKFGIIIPLTAYGQFGVRINDSEAFYRTLVGSNISFEIDALKSYIKGAVYSMVKKSISDAVLTVGRSPFELNSCLKDISAIVERDIQKDVERYGIEIQNFYTYGINVQENNPEVKRLKQALAKKAEMDIIGTSYQQEQTFETMKTALQNSKGSMVGSMVETGIELGVGMKMANEFSKSVNGLFDSSITGAAGNAGKQQCIHCKQPLETESKFCPHCGGRQQLICPECGKECASAARFCDACGKALSGQEAETVNASAGGAQ